LLDLITYNDLTDNFSVFFGKKGNRRDFEHEELRKSLTEDVLSQLARPFPSLDATPEDPSETGRFQPEVAVTADVNGDGILDLITSALLVNEVVVRLGEMTEPGHVQFGREWRFRTPLKDSRMLLARDFDGHGAMDLAIAHTKKKGVSILWGGGPKELFNPKDRKPQVIKVGKAPTFLAADDFDRDGDLDLVVANEGNEGDDTVRVMLFDADDREFRLQNKTIKVGKRPNGIVVARLNDDDLPDLAVLNGGKGGNEGTLSILLGNGDGTFDEQFSSELVSEGSDCKPKKNACRLPVGLNPVAIAAGDFTEDGFVDLVVADRHPGEVRVLAGHENGQFSKPVRVDIAGAAEARLSDLVVADLDNDTHLDVAVSIREANGVVWLNGDGQGGFATQKVVPRVRGDSKGQDPLSIVAAELSGDPWPELITANRKSDNVSVLINVGNDSAPKPTIFGVGISPEAFVDVPVDVDGDRQPDLERRFTATRDDRVTVQERTKIIGEDTFGPWNTKPQSAPDRLARGPLIGDVSGDGVDDIITMNRAGEVFVRIGRGEAGGF